MPPARLPTDEAERLASLRALDILDTGRDPNMDLFTELAATLLGMPMAALSLVDADRAWCKSSLGLEVVETPREHSFSAHAILEPGHVLHVPDAAADPRFADTPLVTGRVGLRFFAGAPLIDAEGRALGTLCVMDHVPRRLPAAKQELLRKLARGAAHALRLHQATRQLHVMALTDPLTGTGNRAGFQQRLEDALATAAALATTARAPKQQVALLVLDLDSFNAVNDLFGHAGGDSVLREAARRLVATTRSTDMVARIGGDEFCVLLPDVPDLDAALGVAARIHATLADSYNLAGKAVPLRTSIGVAVAPDHGADAATLMAQADSALFAAKSAGGGCTRIAFAPGPKGTPALAAPAPVGRNDLERRLRDALIPAGQEPFSLVYQPYFRGADTSLLGFEALVRWRQPDGSMLAPGAFIPVAEASGLIVHLDHWVLRTACREAASWPAPLTVATNLSAANFFAADIAGDVRAMLADAGLPASRLKLEITESVLLRDPERVRAAIEDLRELGVRVALDDFGSGYASIAYLRSYQVDEIKIDRTFVRGIDSDRRTRTLLRAIIDMGRALNLTTLAEGVETENERQVLRQKGISAMQGFLLGRPMDAAAARRLIAERLGVEAVP